MGLSPELAFSCVTVGQSPDQLWASHLTPVSLHLPIYSPGFVTPALEFCCRGLFKTKKKKSEVTYFKGSRAIRKPFIKYQMLCDHLKCEISAPSFSAPSSLSLAKEVVTCQQMLQEFLRPSRLAEYTHRPAQCRWLSLGRWKTPIGLPSASTHQADRRH